MAEYKYSLIRYIPDPIRDEPVNIGLIMHSASEQYLASHWDLRRAGSKMVRPDKGTIKHYEAQLEPIENEEVAWEEASFETISVAQPTFVEQLADYIGNKIRFGEPRGCITDNPDRTFDELFERFVSAGKKAPRRITKRTLVRDVREAFTRRGVGEYVKSKPSIIGEHRQYQFPLGIRHSRRMYIEILKLGATADRNIRAMAAVGRLWQDARQLALNRDADLCALVHYTNGRIREGEELLQEDHVRVVRLPQQILQGVNFARVSEWH